MRRFKIRTARLSLSALILSVFLFSYAIATPDLAEDPHAYIPPRAGDSRAPCPALNTMANHGYIARDGHNLSPLDITRGLRAAYNLSLPLAYFLSFGGWILLGQLSRLSLSDLGRHGNIEHDASLAHRAAAKTEQYAPSQVDFGLYERLIGEVVGRDGDADADGVVGVDEGGEGRRLTTGKIAEVRVRREKEEPIDGMHQEIARGEVALVLEIFGVQPMANSSSARGAVLNGVDRDILRTFWVEERLPDGWKPRWEVGLFETVGVSKMIREAMVGIRQKEIEAKGLKEEANETESKSGGGEWDSGSGDAMSSALVVAEEEESFGGRVPFAHVDGAEKVLLVQEISS